MTLPPAPIRFLLLVIGGWIGLRMVMLLPLGSVTDDRQAGAAPSTPIASTASQTQSAFEPERHPIGATSGQRNWSYSDPEPGFRQPIVNWAFAMSDRPPPRHNAAPSIAQSMIATTGLPVQQSALAALTAPRSPFILPNPRPANALENRLSGSAWVFLRERGDAGLAPGGTLGGSQAGFRLTYRLNADARRPFSVSARLYAPLDRQGAEAGFGIDWRPIAELPINILAERRQRVGREGRSDFAVTIYGGAETRLLGDRVRVEAYGQAGIVGIESRDLFADGSIVATTRVGLVELGGGAWGGAQPGVSRLDVGPHAGFRLPIGRVTIRAAAEWRFRVVGDAEPASGPALTISAGF